ncbi:MAG: FHA domain-containing protein [Planctomycetota bacterium]
MSALTFHSFLIEHQGASLTQLEQAFPAGCLLTRANPSVTTRKATEVFPLLPFDLPRPIRVGRDPELEVCVSHASVSKLHAQFETSAEAPGIWLRDLGSANGTYLNGVRLEANRAVRLEPGTNEVWFADRQLFHFDPAALQTYVDHLSMDLEFVASEIVGPPAGPKAELRATRKMQRPTFDPSATAELGAFGAPVSDPAQEERWRSALTALDSLLVNAERIVLRLALQEDPVTVFDAAKGGDPGSTRAVLEGLRSVVVELKAVLKRSGYELVLFRR